MELNSVARPESIRFGRALVCLMLLGFAALGVSACAGIVTPSGQVETETRDVGEFDKVALSGVGTLIIKPGATASLTVRADKNLMPYVTVNTSGGTLEIGLDGRGRIFKLDASTTLEYELTAPSITAISNSGSGKVTGGPFSGGLFSITDSGSGSVDLTDVSVISLSSTVSGSGAVKIESGVTGAQEVNVSGSGSFTASDLESKVATVKVSGSGSIEVWATEGLDATVSGSGSVSYWGSPQVNENVSGSGHVRSLGAKSLSGSI